VAHVFRGGHEVAKKHAAKQGASVIDNSDDSPGSDDDE
jgi:hypothetical protein